MSESSKGRVPRKNYPQSKKNGENNGSHTVPPTSEAEAVDEPKQPAAEELLLLDSNVVEADRPDEPSVVEADRPDEPSVVEANRPDEPSVVEADQPDEPSEGLGPWVLENGSELTRLLNDADLMDMVVSAMVANSKTVDKLAKELAKKLREAMSSDDELRRWLIDVLIANDKFRQRLVRAMAKSIN